MSNFANWTPLTYANTTYPYITAANLNKNEVALTKTMGELNSYNGSNLKDFIDYAINNNTKIIHNFDTITDFTLTGSMQLSGMFGDSIFGISAVKIQDLNESGGSIGIYDTFTSIDLTTFTSGTSSSTSDYIMFAFYVSDSTKTRNILIRLGDNDTNCYYKFMPSWRTGWNVKKFKKSEFGTDGTPSGWDDITFLRIYVETTTNSSSDYVACAKMWLCRKESGGSTSSPLYVTDGAGTYDSYMYMQGMDDLVADYDTRICKKGIHNAYYYSTDMFQVMSDVNSFSFKAEIYTKIDSDGFTLVWYVNSSNYVHVILRGLSFSIKETVDSTTSYLDVGILTSAIESNDRIDVWIEKSSDNVIRARVEVDGQLPVYTEAVLNLSSTLSGDVGIRSSIDQYYFITDLVCNNNPGVPLPNISNNVQKIAVKFFDSSSLTTTLEDVSDLFMKLPSNSLFEVELILVYSSNGQPGLKLVWDVSGDYEVINEGKVFIGAGEATTSFSDVDVYMANESLDTALELGIVSGGEMPYFEKILIKTGNAGCTLQLQYAQYNASGSYIRIDKGSYIKATKL